MVPRRGLEPPRVAPQVPETCVSTSSTTPANQAGNLLACQGVVNHDNDDILVGLFGGTFPCIYKEKSMSCCKVLAIVAVVVAVVLAALASFLPADQIDYVVATSRFFDIMLPVLAVGALIKYLFTRSKCCCNQGDKKGMCS